MKIQRPKDYQKAKCYAWERASVEPLMDGEKETLESARALVDRILTDYGLRWAPRSSSAMPPDSFQAMGKHLVVWKRGTRSGKFQRGGNCAYSAVRDSGRPMLQELRISSKRELVLHETAHLICDQTTGVRGRAGHDSTFIAMLIELLDRYSEAWACKADELRASALQAGLTVASTPFTVGMAAAPAPKTKKRAAKTKPAKEPQPKHSKQPRKKPDGPGVKSTCETPVAVVRRLAEANPTAKFAEIVKLAAAEGVNPNTARGALVRYKQALNKEQS